MSCKRALSDAHDRGDGVGKRAAAMSGTSACAKWINTLREEGFFTRGCSLPRTRGTIMVVGSYNAGKTALVNRIINENLLTSAPVEQTAVPWAIVQRGTNPDMYLTSLMPNIVWAESQGGLKDITLIDTPGYGGVDCGDASSMFSLIDASQAAILCISSQTPVTMQDVEMASKLSQRNRRVLVILTKSDLSRDASELEAVINSVRKRLAPALRHPPQVWPVSSNDAGCFQLRSFISELHQLEERSWLNHALLATASFLLSDEHDRAIAQISLLKTKAESNDESIRAAVSTIEHLADSLMSEIAVCRHRINQQAANFSGTLSDDDPALSAPLISLRTQISHATEMARRELLSLLPAGDKQDVPGTCIRELKLFETNSVEHLLLAEKNIDGVIDPDVLDKRGNSQATTTAELASMGGLTTASIVLSTIINPAVSLCAVVAGAYGLHRHRQKQERERDDLFARRRLIGHPNTILDAVVDNVERMQTRLKSPLIELCVATSDKQSQLEKTLEQLETVQRVCRRSIDLDLASNQMTMPSASSVPTDALE